MRGCLTCRQRHLKCDKSGRECLRCQRSGRPCVPAPEKPEEVTFRHGQNPSLRPQGPVGYGERDLVFPDDQVWVYMPPQFSFEDETHHTIAEPYSPSIGKNARESPDEQSSARMVALSSFPLTKSADSKSNSGLDSSSGSRVDLLPPQPLKDCQKLQSFNEAFLLRWFRKTLGAWLDVCDSQRHFSTDVVERASTCPLILYACLATAARHLSYSSKAVPPGTADEYHERCIAILLPGLDHQDFQIDIEILLAATVILRLFEQISSHSPSNDQQRHLLAGSVYISSYIDCATSDDLATASFWVFVMQDIQSALAHQRPLRLILGPFDPQLRQKWQSHASQTEEDWTHQAIWLLAETINYYYGTDSRPTIELSHTEMLLKMKINTWDRESPESFCPLHFFPADHHIGRPFPFVSFTNTSHAIAVQHICLAKALIHACELRRLRVIAADNSANAKIEEDDVTENLSIVFGIALSTEGEAPLRFMACHAVCAFISWIHDSLSRNCLLDLLRQTELENGWPWAFLVEDIIQRWELLATP